LSQFYRKEKKMMRILWSRMTTLLKMMAMIMKRTKRLKNNMIQSYKPYSKKKAYPRRKRKILSEI